MSSNPAPKPEEDDRLVRHPSKMTRARQADYARRKNALLFRIDKNENGPSDEANSERERLAKELADLELAEKMRLRLL